MTRFLGNYMTKTLAVLISLLLCWQSVVWAGEDIILRDELQPETLFSIAEDESSFLSLFTSYLAKYLIRIEQDPANHNIFKMREQVERAIGLFRAGRVVPATLVGNLPMVTCLPDKGELIIDGSVYRIKYYNPRIAEPETPVEPFRIISQEEIGEYFSRQVIVHGSRGIDPFGNIQDEPEERSTGLPEKEPDNKDDGPGSASLSFIGKKLTKSYSPFSHAPVLEELFKIGIPLGALYLLEKTGLSTTILSAGVFYGLLVILGTVFTMLHMYNQKDNDASVKNIFRVFTAPAIVAAGGVVLAVFLNDQKMIALVLGMTLHLAVNLVVAFLRKSGLYAGYAAFRGKGEIIRAAVSHAEAIAKEEKLVLDHYEEIKTAIFEKYGVDLQDDEYGEARHQIAGVSAVQDPRRTMEEFKVFAINPLSYGKAIEEIAVLCSEVSAEHVVINFSKLGLDISKHRDHIVAIAKECAKRNAKETARYFKNFGFDPLINKTDIWNVAMICVRRDGRATARHFKNFGIDPKRSVGDLLTAKTVALSCARQNGEGIAVYFKEFGFDPISHKNAIITVAKACADSSGRGTAKSFRNFGLDPQKDREAIENIAAQCARQDIDSTLEFFDNFRLGFTEEEALAFCNKAEREYIMELAHSLSRNAAQRSLGENGITFLSMADEVFYSLDLADLSIGAQSYVKALILEHVLNKESISEAFVEYMQETVVPALRSLEAIVEGYPTMGVEGFPATGVEYVLNPDFGDTKKTSNLLLRVKLANYLSRVKTPYKLDRSYSWQKGEWQIRIPPAPYPVMRLLIHKMNSLSILGDDNYKITVSGDYMEHGLFLFMLLYYANSPRLEAVSLKEVPGRPWVRGGELTKTVDPWTGEVLSEEDVRTRGTQTQFIFSGDSGSIEQKLGMTFALVTSAAAYLGEYGIKDAKLKALYDGLRREVIKFLNEEMNISKPIVGRLFPSMEKDFGYRFDVKEVESALDAINAKFKKSLDDNETRRIEKERLYAEFKDIKEGHMDKINGYLFQEGIKDIRDIGFSEKFAKVKPTVLSMCFGDEAVRKKAARIAEKAYPEEYEKIVKADAALRPPARPEVLAIKEKAGPLVDKLINALLGISKRDEKVILALDTTLGRGEINLLLKKLIDILPELEKNNDDLKRFFRNLVIIKGEGRELASRVSGVTDPSRGSVKPENVVVVTSEANLILYDRIEGRATITAIDDTAFPETAYLPLLEIMLFSIGRHLGWSENALREHYANIPNILPLNDLQPEECSMLFGEPNSTLVIKLIPEATRFDKREIREIMDNLRIMLSRA